MIAIIDNIVYKAAFENLLTITNAKINTTPATNKNFPTAGKISLKFPSATF